MTINYNLAYNELLLHGFDVQYSNNDLKSINGYSVGLSSGYSYTDTNYTIYRLYDTPLIVDTEIVKTIVLLDVSIFKTFKYFKISNSFLLRNDDYYFSSRNSSVDRPTWNETYYGYSIGIHKDIEIIETVYLNLGIHIGILDTIYSKFRIGITLNP
jgi:hypothetical protein